MFLKQIVAGRNIHEGELSAVVFQTLPFSVNMIYLYMCVQVSRIVFVFESCFFAVRDVPQTLLLFPVSSFKII